MVPPANSAQHHAGDNDRGRRQGDNATQCADRYGNGDATGATAAAAAAATDVATTTAATGAPVPPPLLMAAALVVSAESPATGHAASSVDNLFTGSGGG